MVLKELIFNSFSFTLGRPSLYLLGKGVVVLIVHYFLTVCNFEGYVVLGKN